MAKFEETATALRVELGMPKFNGSVVVFDKAVGTAQIEQTNLFFKSKPVQFALADIEAVYLVKAKSAAYPQIALKSGKTYSLASFAAADANEAVPRIVSFLAKA